VHISELQHGRTEKTEDVVKKGDRVRVKVIERDERGRLRLSMKALIPKPGADGAAAEPAYSDATGAAGGDAPAAPREERPRREGGDRGGRGGRGGRGR
jgi:polyribonucleotide nucleotidyltransferase